MPALPRFSSLLIAAASCLAVLLIGRMPRANDGVPPRATASGQTVLPASEPYALPVPEPIALPAPDGVATTPESTALPPGDYAAQPAELPAPRSGTAPAAVAADPMVPGQQDLLRLRARLGSPFDGTVLEQEGGTSDQKAFAAALQQVAAESPPLAIGPKPALPAGPELVCPAAVDAPPPGVEQCPEPVAVTPLPDPEMLSPPPGGRKALRSAAQQLDRVADELEETEFCYDEADALRELADVLRMRARR